MDKINVLGVSFDNVTPVQAVSAALAADNSAFVVTPNPEIVWLARTNSELREAISNAELVLADGIGIIYGAKILGTPLVGRVTGMDFVALTMERLAERGGSAFLLGSKPRDGARISVAEMAARQLKSKYKGLRIAGTRDGYFKDEETDEIVAAINESKPDLLLVCLGAPKQELWAYRNRERLNVPLIACLGGALDVWAGTVKRAPRIFQRLGLEWLYRLIKQPSRLRRMMSLPKFLFAVIGAKISGKNR